MQGIDALGEQLDSLLSISADIASLRELQAVEDRALTYCLHLTDSEFGFIGLLNDDQDEMTVDAIKGFEPYMPGFVEQYRFMSVRPSVFGVTITEGRPYISNDVDHDPHRVGTPPGHPPLRTFLGIPLRVSTTLIGIMGVANKSNGYNATDERLLSTFANQVAIAIDNARLYEQQRQMIMRLVSVVELATSSSLSGMNRRPAFRREGEPLAPRRSDTGQDSVRASLTPAQREVLSLLVQGRSNREIAEHVHLSEHTVKSHVHELFRKLDVRNRVEAAIKATNDGLL